MDMSGRCDECFFWTKLPKSKRGLCRNRFCCVFNKKIRCKVVVHIVTPGYFTCESFEPKDIEEK